MVKRKIGLQHFSQPVPLWGLRDKYKNLFNMVETGDIIWCYVTYPISGIIGIGIYDIFTNPLKYENSCYTQYHS